MRCLLLVVLLAGGCQTSLPTYGWVDTQTAMQTLSDRTAKIESVSSRCRLILSRDGDGTTQLDGVLVAQLPDHFRLRAFKFSQPVLDVTSTPEGVWVYLSKRRGMTKSVGKENDTVNALSRAISRSSFGLSGSHWEDSPGGDEDTFRVRRRLDDSDASVLVDVDRATLTVRQCSVRDQVGNVTATVSFDRYRMFDGHVWPTIIAARSDQGSIRIMLDRVELNGAVSDRAFIPPRRAIKQ